MIKTDQEIYPSNLINAISFLRNVARGKSEDSRKWLSHPETHPVYTRAMRKRGEWMTVPSFPLIFPIIF